MSAQGHPRPARAAMSGRVVLTGLALVALVGCSSAAPAEEPAAPSPQSASSAPSGGGTPAPVESETEDGVGPPDLTGLGDVTPEQLRFAEENTLGGMDAAAVLVAAEDTCKRMVFLQDSGGQESLVVGMVAGDFANYQEVVTLLCPQLVPALEVASTGIADGDRAVSGSEVTDRTAPAGRYRSLQPGPSCSWSQSRGDVVVRSGSGDGPAQVELLDGDAFSSTGCLAWVP